VDHLRRTQRWREDDDAVFHKLADILCDRRDKEKIGLLQSDVLTIV
jgi:hypothetical protein